VTQDFADFLAALNSEGVAYVVIGGIAVLAHVPYRTTRDLDVLIEPSLVNARRTRRAVERWGGFVPQFTAEEFIAGDVLSFGGLLRVEILSRVPGTTWESVWKNSVEGELLGIPTRFAGVDDLIAMKSAVGRKDKDIPDLERLRRLRERSNEP
jgi:hypothetical protein